MGTPKPAINKAGTFSIEDNETNVKCCKGKSWGHLALLKTKYRNLQPSKKLRRKSLALERKRTHSSE